MKFRRRSKRPAFDAITFDHFRDLVGQLFINPAIGLVLELGLGNGSAMLQAGAIANGKSPGLVGYFVEEFAMRVGRIKRLH